jgi:hypothetical protein
MYIVFCVLSKYISRCVHHHQGYETVFFWVLSSQITKFSLAGAHFFHVSDQSITWDQIAWKIWIKDVQTMYGFPITGQVGISLKKLFFLWHLFIFIYWPPRVGRNFNITYLLCVKSKHVYFIFTKRLCSNYKYYITSNLSIVYL